MAVFAVYITLGVMNFRPYKGFVPTLAIVVVSALVGLSFSRVDATAAEDPVWFALAGAVVGLVASAVVRAFSSGSALKNVQANSRNHKGLRIAFVGFCVALLGWLVAVFIHHVAGLVFVAFGIGCGFFGVAVQIALNLHPEK